MSCWEILDIEPTSNLNTIKRAYALKFKELQAENKKAEFEPLKEALATAMAYAKDPANAENIEESENAVEETEIVASTHDETEIDEDTHHFYEFEQEFYRLFDEARDEPYEWVSLLNEDRFAAANEDDKHILSEKLLSFLVTKQDQGQILHESILRQLNRLLDWSQKLSEKPNAFPSKQANFIATIDSPGNGVVKTRTAEEQGSGNESLSTLFYLIGFLFFIVLICLQAIK